MNPPARTLAGHLDDYLTLRRALGCELLRPERYLRQFLDYLGERQQDTLTVKAAADWVGQSRHGSGGSRPVHGSDPRLRHFPARP
jgi:hypothetical protein